jgi:hypothetical protein
MNLSLRDEIGIQDCGERPAAKRQWAQLSSVRGHGIEIVRAEDVLGSAGCRPRITETCINIIREHCHAGRRAPSR